MLEALAVFMQFLHYHQQEVGLAAVGLWFAGWKLEVWANSA